MERTDSTALMVDCPVPGRPLAEPPGAFRLAGEPPDISDERAVLGTGAAYPAGMPPSYPAHMPPAAQ